MTIKPQNRAIEMFREIANMTNGQYGELNSPNDLIDVVCMGALEEIGGAELVAEYSAK